LLVFFFFTVFDFYMSDSCYIMFWRNHLKLTALQS